MCVQIGPSVANLCHRKAVGVKTLSSAWTESVSSSAFDLISFGTASALGTRNTRLFVHLTAGAGLTVKTPIPIIKDDLSNLDVVVETIVGQDADAFSGA